MVCIVEGGDPAPQISWFRDGVEFDSETDPSTYQEVLQNTLVISALDRSFHGNRLECRAVNNNVTDPPRLGKGNCRQLMHFFKKKKETI